MFTDNYGRNNLFPLPFLLRGNYMTPDCFIALKKKLQKRNESAALRPDALLDSSHNGSKEA